MKRLAPFWNLYFVGGVGFFVLSVFWADQAAVPLVVLAFNAGIWLAQWFAGFQIERLCEAMALGRALCNEQQRIIATLSKQIEEKR